MINKLKRKFILLATVSMLALMTVLVGVINIVNYSVVVKESDTTIDILLRADRRDNIAPPDGENITPPNGDEITPPNVTGTPPNNADGNLTLEKNASGTQPNNTDGNGFDGKLPPGVSPEVPYEARYFTVTLSSAGEIIKTDFSKILSVDASTVSEYLKKATSSKKERGFIGQFRFAKQTDGQTTTVLFLDCGRKLDAFMAFLWTSICVGFIGCVIVFVAFVLLADKIVKPIAESYAKQKRFISDAGHEIKTPLTIIMANLDLLEAENPKKNDEFDEIRTQTKRLSELTGNLVCLSKMEEEEHKINKIEMPLSDTATETLASFKALAATKKLNFTADIQPDITVCAAPDSIRQLVSILAENAIKYSPENGTVKITLSANKKNATLSVYNTTIAHIEKSDLPHVFDRFYRADASRNSQTGGHGIGLSIAKAITQAHGGSIKAESTDGNDFCVTATLPLK